MRALISAALLLAPLPAIAQTGPSAASAHTFLQSIYAYYHKGSIGAPLKPLERWFEPGLAGAIRKDDADADRRGDVGALDGDPFCDCQDFDPFTATIGPAAIAGDRATATVSFRNQGQVSLRYTLVWTRAGWRVFDIQWSHGSLRGLYFRRG